MKISDNGLAIVKAFEGCHRAIPGRPGYFKAYVDPVGVLTIGWGHTNHHLPQFDTGTVWSQQQCDDVLLSDLVIFERHVERLAKVTLEQHEFDALVSWAYNTGGPVTATLWKRLNAGNKAAVPTELARWNKGDGQVLAGLVRRRKAEAELFQGRFAEAFATAGVAAPAPVLPTPAPVWARPTIRLGDTGDYVRSLQAMLEMGGEFGPKTDAAVRKYQANKGLVVDGIVGPQTWGSLLS